MLFVSWFVLMQVIIDTMRIGIIIPITRIAGIIDVISVLIVVRVWP